MVVFAVIEHTGERLNWYQSWQPSSLRKGKATPVDRSSLITNLIIEGAFLLWWNDVLTVQDWIPVVGGNLALADAWSPWFWPLNFIFALWFGVHAYVLFRDLWGRFTLSAEVILGAAAIIIAIRLVGSGELVLVSGELAEQLAPQLQLVARLIIFVAMGFTSWDMAIAARNMKK